MKIRIAPLDKLFSQYIRNRDRECQRCHSGNTRLECAHFHGRRKKSVRFEPDNACAFCFQCHMYMHENPAEHVDFMKKRLGKRYDLLTVSANNATRPDYAAIKLWLKAMIKGQEEKDKGGMIYGRH